MTLNLKDRIQDEYDWQQTVTVLYNYTVIIICSVHSASQYNPCK